MGDARLGLFVAKIAAMASIRELYDEDFYLWALHNAAALREGRLADLDTQNLAEEIESMAGRERRELQSRITQILEHLLKLRLAKGLLLEYNQGGWQASILRQRREIGSLIRESPSLKRRIVPELIQECYREAGATVALEYKVEPPAECPFSVEDIL
jgi:hypothetical protein